MEPTERILDAFVHERVMGAKDAWLWNDGPQCRVVDAFTPYYSTDIAAAWLVLSAFTGYELKKEGPSIHRCMVWRDTGLAPWPRGFSDASTIERAICLAALKAVGVEIS